MRMSRITTSRRHEPLITIKENLDTTLSSPLKTRRKYRVHTGLSGDMKSGKPPPNGDNRAMGSSAARSFAERFKALVDRLCETEGLTRQDLANDLGVNLNSISGSVYRGGVNFNLVERIALRAKASPQELSDLELAWLEMQRSRAGLRHDNLIRAVEIIEALREELDAVEAWLDKRGLLEDFRKSRRGSALLRRMRQRTKDS